MAALHALSFLIHRFYLCPLIFVVLLTPALAQVPTAITSDGSLDTTVTQNGNVFDITDGTRQGSNLFHSFDRFDVGTGDTARFTGPMSVTSILSRVTGGSASMIDGTLQSDIAGANLYLLNPNGVIFGANAALDVQGSFHVSTGDYIRLEDGGIFAVASSETRLTIAFPVAFGFVSTSPAAITIDGSQLRVPGGKAISLIGGNITITGRDDGMSSQTGRLDAPSGRINITSVASQGKVTTMPSESGQVLDVTSFEHLGEIALTGSVRLDVSGTLASSGTVTIRGGHLLIQQADIVAATSGVMDGAALGIDLQIRESIILAKEGVLRSHVNIFGSGRGGNINIKTAHLHLEGEVFSNTEGPGNAGDITIYVETMMMKEGFIGAGALGSPVNTGSAGEIIVRGETITLAQGAEIDSSTFNSGQGGAVTIEASSALLITGRNDQGEPSGIFSQAQRMGDAGQIVIQSPVIQIDNGGMIATPTLVESEGKAGDIVIDVGHLSLQNSSRIDSSSIGTGNAGSVTIRGIGGNGTAATTVTLTDNSTITTFAEQAEAGNITISAAQVKLHHNASITVETAGLGDAGEIQILATDMILLETDSKVTTSALEASGGVIDVSTSDILRLQDSRITASVFGSSGTIGGNVFIHSEFVVLARSQIMADATNGDGGRIDIESDALLADPTSVISASSELGNDGEVNIQSLIADLSGTLSPLSQTFTSTKTILPDRCAKRLRGVGISSFVLAGRDRIPTQPGDLLPSPLLEGVAPRAQTGEQMIHPLRQSQSITAHALAAQKQSCTP